MVHHPLHVHHVYLQAAKEHLNPGGNPYRVGASQYIVLVSDGFQTAGGDQEVIVPITDAFKANNGPILSLAAGGDESGEQKINADVMSGIASEPKVDGVLPSFYRAFQTVAELEPVINSFLDTICEEVRAVLMMMWHRFRCAPYSICTAHAALIRSSAARSRASPSCAHTSGTIRLPRRDTLLR